MKRILSCILCTALMITMSGCCCSFLYEQEKKPNVVERPTVTTAPPPVTNTPVAEPTDPIPSETEDVQNVTVQGILIKEYDGYYLQLSEVLTVGSESVEKLQVEITDDEFAMYNGETIVISGGFIRTHIGKHVLRECTVEKVIPSEDEDEPISPVVEDAMTDYYDTTTADIIEMYGDEYTLSDYLIAGGWRAMYFDPDVTPIVFCYQSYEFETTTCTGNERIEGVFLYSKGSQYYDGNVVDNIKPTDTYEDISAVLNGKFYENLLEGGYSFAPEVDGPYGIVFTWSDKNGTDLMEILVQYKY